MKYYLSFILLIWVCLFSACSAGPPADKASAVAEPFTAYDANMSVESTEESGSLSGINAFSADLNTQSENTSTPPEEVPPYNEYYVKLEVEPETRIIRGVERIRFTNRNETPLSEVVIRLYLNAFSETAVMKPYFPTYENKIFSHGVDYGWMNILHVSLENDELPYTANGTVLTVELDEALAFEQTIQILIQFEAYVPQIAHRTGANEHALWCGTFLPILSVYDADGWHTEPYYPAGDPFYMQTKNYTVEITTPDGYMVAGTGDKKEVVLEDKKITTFTARMSRDFAFAVSSEYEMAQAVTGSGVDIQFYYYSKNLRIDEILDLAVRSLEYFESRIGAYPYAQLCIAETDMFVSGMEFSKILFMDSSFLQRNQALINLTHEIGHQWFFNIVGNNQLAEAWLDEGVTMFIQETFFSNTEELLREKMAADYASLQRSHARITDSDCRKLTAPVSAYDNWVDYYQIHYMKAKMMVYALYCIMGEDTFWVFMNEYYKANSFRVATAVDFISKAEEVYGRSLTDFFDEWMGSSLPKLPK